MSDPIRDLFSKAALAGQRIRGGCDTYDAYQTLTEVQPHVWSLIVHHDDCPSYRAMKAGNN